MDKLGLYMFAVVPPEPTYTEVQDFKLYFAKKYNAKEAVRKPAHITLIPPFKIPLHEEPSLVNFTEKSSQSYEPFEILIDGFGEFQQSTIYCKPTPNESLAKLQKDLSKSFSPKFRRIGSKGSGYGFHPHMTVAYRDLSRPMFEKAWEEFRDKIYRRRFLLDHICLMRHYANWTTIAEGKLSGTMMNDELDLFS